MTSFPPELHTQTLSYTSFPFLGSALGVGDCAYMCVYGGRGMRQVSPALPGNVFIFLDPSSSLLHDGVAPLLSPGPHGAF